MTQFRKRPVIIDAVPVLEVLRDARSDWPSLPQWLRDAYDEGGVVFESDAVSLPTLEGTMRADSGDWIIRGVQGELYPCKPDIFTETYEPVAT